MPKFTATVQYPWTVYHELTIEVEAANIPEASRLAIHAADRDWSAARQSDGEMWTCGWGRCELH